jgi:alkylation response protein AidB-like acyl-CoA dehydrogenase
MDFRESEELRSLRAAVAGLGARYGRDYYLDRARSGRQTVELWAEAGRLGYLGVNIPAEHGGGGGGIAELAVVLEELGAAGCPLLMMVVSPAICGTVITRFGTEEQKKRWLPGLADGSLTMAFAITEPDAGSNSHNLATVARRADDGWVLNGRKMFITGVDGADAVLVVGRTEDARTGRLRPALFVVPTDTPGLTWQQIEMEIVSTEKQFALFFDDLRLPDAALIGGHDGDSRLLRLFAGLNPERIMTAALALGVARHALGKAVDYAGSRAVWGQPIGAHQGLAHPLGSQCGREAGTAVRERRYG